jgi:hypothetical protein
MLLSRKALQRILGMLWLIDGLLQLQPQMFTMNMVSSIMKPVLQGQPGIIEPSLQFIVTQTTLHLTAVNLLVASVQVCLGLGFLLLPDRWVKVVVLAPIVWAFIVWYGGEACEKYQNTRLIMIDANRNGRTCENARMSCEQHTHTVRYDLDWHGNRFQFGFVNCRYGIGLLANSAGTTCCTCRCCHRYARVRSARDSSTRVG